MYPPVLLAPAHWQRVEFISDLHLSADDPVTFDTWQAYMQACTCDALFILGDLFEAWVGDDVLTTAEGFAFEKQCAQVLKAASLRCPVYLLHGNRDFLLGDTFFRLTGVQPLPDPCRLEWLGESVLLSHGDALCVNDTAYMQLRALIRSPQWQTATLAKPLTERMTMVAHIKMDKAQRNSPPQDWMDVDPTAANECLQHHRVQTLVHGHTHMPGDYALPQGCRRIVLSDWEGRGLLPRAQVLCWEHVDNTPQWRRVDLAPPPDCNRE